MLRVFDYANISNDVYGQPFQINYLHKHSEASRVGSGIFRMLDADPTQNINKPFYAQLYINFRNSEAVDAVIGYRGTWKVGHHWYSGYTDFEVDAGSWYKSVLVSNQSSDSLPGDHFADYAARFYIVCRDYLKEYFPSVRLSRLHVTGHSLGGALAALMPAYNCFPTMAVTFNAPGIATIPKVKADMGGRIIGIEARYDFVSKIGEHVEKLIYLVDVPEMESTAKEAFVMSGEINKLSQEIRVDPVSLKAEGLTVEAQSDARIEQQDMQNSALAQHKMINLLNALKEPKYSALANKLVT